MTKTPLPKKWPTRYEDHVVSHASPRNVASSNGLRLFCFYHDQPGSYFVLDSDIVSISAEQYETLYNKWHAKLGAVFMGSLNSSEYMVIRACLLVLTRIVDEFPTRPGLGQRLMDALEPIQQDSYPLQDIKTAAQAYGMLLGNAGYVLLLL